MQQPIHLILVKNFTGTYVHVCSRLKVICPPFIADKGFSYGVDGNPRCGSVQGGACAKFVPGAKENNADICYMAEDIR